MRPSPPGAGHTIVLALALALPSVPGPLPIGPVEPVGAAAPAPSPVANFTGALDRLVELAGAGGGAILSLVWVRVALSWFSNDVTKKIQAKDRARDALIGTLVFTAAVTGLVWALAQWVVSGT